MSGNTDLGRSINQSINQSPQEQATAKKETKPSAVRKTRTVANSQATKRVQTAKATTTTPKKPLPKSPMKPYIREIQGGEEIN